MLENCAIGKPEFPHIFRLRKSTILIFIGPRYTWGPIYGSRVSVTERGFADLTDVTLADEDTNSILIDNANRAIQGNVATILTLPC